MLDGATHCTGFIGKSASGMVKQSPAPVSAAAPKTSSAPAAQRALLQPHCERSALPVFVMTELSACDFSEKMAPAGPPLFVTCSSMRLSPAGSSTP